jgi:hypothetical protein
VFRFAEKKVDVLRHEDIAEDVELMTTARVFEDVEEDGAGVVVVEEGKPAVAAEVMKWS